MTMSKFSHTYGEQYVDSIDTFLEINSKSYQLTLRELSTSEENEVSFYNKFLAENRYKNKFRTVVMLSTHLCVAEVYLTSMV